jgi:excisionase family DNA binding protein
MEPPWSLPCDARLRGLLGVRGAARMLGVHENTLRRWEQSGLISAYRLPSGVRRFRPEDVEGLARDIYGADYSAAVSAAANGARRPAGAR